MVRAKAPLALVLVVLSLSGCARSAQQYYDSGNRYLQQKKVKEATIEFKSAIQEDPRLGVARLKLADVSVLSGDLRTALGEYIKASDLMPDSVEAQLKAGTFLLWAQRFDDAEIRAKRVLEKDPKNLEARLLQANVSFKRKEFETAIAQAEEAIRLDPKAVTAYGELGKFEQAKGDIVGAERAYRTAVEIDPSSVNAHLALGNFLFTTDRQGEAEASLKQAHQLAQKNTDAARGAARMLAAFYVASNRAPEAEPYLKSLADEAQVPGPRLALADYYAALGRPDAAVSVLTKVAEMPGGFGPATIRIAAIDYSRDRKAQAHATIDGVLEKEPKNAAALLTKARFFAAEKKFDEAVAKATLAVAADPNSVDGHYLLGVLYSSRNNADEAIKEFTEVLRLNPRATAAQMQLARLQLLKGAAPAAVRYAEQANAAQPDDPNVRMMLVRTLMAQGNVARAETELKTLAAQYPESAVVLSATGSLLLMKGDQAGARKAYEKSAAIDSNALEPVVGLVTLDIAAKNGAAARARVDARLAKTPTQPEALVLAARTYATLGDLAAAEQALLKTIELAPNHLQAYGMLGQIYLNQKKLDLARQKFADLAARQSKPIGAETMVAIILQMQGKPAEAQKQYEKVLALDPRAAVAANNLAWMYAESGSNLELAAQLAQAAKAGLPDAPEVDDTLGWVYYRKNLPGLALGPLQRAVEAAPGNAAYHFHLGMLYAKTGEKDKAKNSLQKALALDPAFEGAVEAKTTLAALQ